MDRPRQILELPVRRLGLGNTKTQRLIDSEVTTVRDFINAGLARLLRVPGLGRGAVEQAFRRIDLLSAQVTLGTAGNVDPLSRPLDEEIAATPIRHLKLGKIRNQRLQKANINTVGDFLAVEREKLLRIPGIGTGAVDRAFDEIRLMVIRKNESISDERTDAGQTEETGKAKHSDEQINQMIAPMPIGVLHLGVKVHALNRAGFRTVGDLFGVSEKTIADAQMVGRRTASAALAGVSFLRDSTDPESGTDWQQYCRFMNLNLLPTEFRGTSGKEFLGYLPRFIDDVAASLADDTITAILRERICQPPGKQKTLEELARGCVPQVTRERIRQKEKKLLDQLSGGLLNDLYGSPPIHFDPEYTKWWRKAADSLEHLEEIDAEEFVSRLASVWEVTSNAIMDHFPVIVAIVTGEPQMNAGFRSAAKIDPVLFEPANESITSLPVTTLRLGRYAKSFTDAGIETVGEVLSLLRSGGPRSVGPIAAAKATKRLGILATCVSPEGHFDREEYRRRLKLETFPRVFTETSEDFVEGLQSAISQLLSISDITPRATDVYAMRTSRIVRDQMTLQEVADRLATHGPTIKREETILLRFLNEIVIGEDFSSLPVWMDSRWLVFWKEAEAVRLSSTQQYSNFAENLAWRWRLTERQITKATPTIWAVLTGYPENRMSRKRVRKSPSSQDNFAHVSAAPAGKIKLRGFRRLH